MYTHIYMYTYIYIYIYTLCILVYIYIYINDMHFPDAGAPCRPASTRRGSRPATATWPPAVLLFSIILY